MSEEEKRLQEAKDSKAPWKKWGPYLSERQWGTVREDYSDSGDAWNYFSHDQARSRAYRWGEDGLAGISDDEQHLCFALALWNGKDPILKERIFGLTNSEGNHGEDVKEYYFYLDSTPTHSYMKYLYKYPQKAYPYADLVDTNKNRTRNEMEYELLDTGAFDGDRYFDVFVEYAKASPEDILIRITVCNRGPETAELHVLPTLWFRNDWSEWISRRAEKPSLKQVEEPADTSAIAATHPELGTYYLYAEGKVPVLFTENETNNERLFPEHPNMSPYVKDGINNFVIDGQRDKVNPALMGTKAAAHYRITVGAGKEQVIKLRLTTGSSPKPFGQDFDTLFAERLREADAFYATVIPSSVSADEGNVMRQHALVQAVLLLRCRPVARGARRRPFQAQAARPAQRPLAPHVQCGDYLDAGQVGIPLVCGMGPGLPHPPAGPGRCGLRQAAAGSHAQGGLFAPQRATSRVRVELR